MPTPKYTIVTTCKNRLDHLKSTLPGFLAFEDAEVIVVDYNCPQGTGDFVSENYPAARVVRVTDDEGFNISRARNVGARQATGEYLFFIDADIKIHPARLRELMQAQERLNRFIVFSRVAENPNLDGTCLLPKEVFDKVGGYDEAIRVWGGEDWDLYVRLRFHGLEQFVLDAGDSMTAIEHSNAERLTYHRNVTLGGSILITTSYRQLKLGIMRILGRELNGRERAALWNSVASRFNEGFRSDKDQFDMVIEVPLETPHLSIGGTQFSRKLVLTVKKGS